MLAGCRQEWQARGGKDYTKHFGPAKVDSETEAVVATWDDGYWSNIDALPVMMYKLKFGTGGPTAHGSPNSKGPVC